MHGRPAVEQDGTKLVPCVGEDERGAPRIQMKIGHVRGPTGGEDGFGGKDGPAFRGSLGGSGAGKGSSSCKDGAC